MSKYFAHNLAGTYLIFSIVLGINPVSRDVWIVEIIPVIVIFVIFAFTFRTFRFSNLAYGLVFV